MNTIPLTAAVRDAVAEILGDAYDCTRVWNAWNVGTMSQDDFQLVTDDSDRVQEIAQAALDALPPVYAAAPDLLKALEALVGYDEYETEYDGRMYGICPSCGVQDGNHRPTCEFEIARAAIAKATGAA